ncbi:MAG TPA: V-type ATP synthase subunit E family protein, partial [Nitrososphaeraceae archaeon]
MERTIDKVLSQTESELMSRIDSALQDSLNNLESSKSLLQSDYENVIESSKKQAENLKRQIIGASKLGARNKELVVVESAINNVFLKAKERLMSGKDKENYKNLLNRMISDSISKLESPKILIECNKEDHKLVKQIISELPDKKITVNLSDKPLEIMGGIKASTAD